MKPALETNKRTIGHGPTCRAVAVGSWWSCFAGAAAAVLYASAAGCSWVDDNGQRRHLVLGLGVISTGRDAAGANGGTEDASVERVRATGLFLGAGPVVNGLMFGWANVQTVRIDPGAEVLIEASSHADGSLRVRAESVRKGGGDGKEDAQKGNGYP